MDGATILFISLFVLTGLVLVIGLFSAMVKHAKRKNIEMKAKEKHEQNINDLIKHKFKAEEQYHSANSTIYLYYDYQKKQAALEYYDPKLSCSGLTIFPLDQIVECELVQDGSVVSKEMATFSGATVWGVGGIAGAKVASAGEQVGVLAVRLLINDMRISSVVINVLEASISKTEPLYQARFIVAQEIYAKFRGIVRINHELNAGAPAAVQQPHSIPAQNNAQPTEDIMNQIKKLAELKNEGILTEEEFTAKKKILMDKIQ